MNLGATRAQPPRNALRIADWRGWLSAALATDGVGRAGLAGLYLLAFGYVASKPLANVGLALVAAAFLVTLVRCPSQWRDDPLVRVGIAWLVYVAALVAWRAHRQMPGSLLGAENLCLALIPAIAWATAGRVPRIVVALLLMLAGLLVRLALDIRSIGWPWFDYSNTPYMFGVNRNISSLMLDTAIVGVLVWLLSSLRAARHESGHWWGVAGRAALLVALLGPWIAAPSRTLWLSLVVVVALMLARLSAHSRKWIVLIVAGTVVAVVVLMLNTGHFGTILLKDVDTWRVLLAGDWSSVPDSSSGYRFRMLQMGFEALAANPWTGVANAGAQILREHPDFPLSYVVQLHNGYLEILVRTGLVGFGFFAVALTLAFRAMRNAAGDGRIPWELRELLLAGLQLFLLVNLTNAVVFFQHGWQFLVIFSGIAYGFASGHQAPKEAAGADDPVC